MNWLIKLAKYKAIFAVMAALALSFALSPVALATPGANCGGTNPPCGANEDCISGKCVVSIDDAFGLGKFKEGTGDILGDPNQDLRTTVGSIINVALGLLGVVAVVIVLLGGFKWMTAGGNEERATEARKLILAGIIGLAIILSAWAIAVFVLRSLANATGAGGSVPETF